MDELTPLDIPEAHAIIRRLCALQAHVCTEVLGHDDPADCFCGQEGFWPYSDPDDYRNAGKAIDFIVEATLAAVERARSQNPRKRQNECDHCDGMGEVLEPSRTPEEESHMIPCANCSTDSNPRKRPAA
jgi:hypothetical protein